MQEASGVRIHFQQAMNGFGRVTGRFSQSLGGSACGRCQRKGNFLGMQNFENGRLMVVRRRVHRQIMKRCNNCEPL